MYCQASPSEWRDLWSTLGLDALALVWSLDLEAVRSLPESERRDLLHLTRQLRDERSLTATSERLQPLSDAERLRHLLNLSRHS